MGKKLYGPGNVAITVEDNFGEAVEIDKLCRVQAITMPALNHEVIENTANRPNRGSNPPLIGAQSALDFEITTLLYDTKTDSIEHLRQAGGVAPAGDPYTNTEYRPTLQIVRTDRDGTMAEILHGCITTSITQNWSNSDKCSEVFAGTASTKTEFQSMDDVSIDGSAWEADDVVDLGFVYGRGAAQFPDKLGVYFFNADWGFIGIGAPQSDFQHVKINYIESDTVDKTVKFVRFIIDHEIVLETADDSKIIAPGSWTCAFSHNAVATGTEPQTVTVTYETGLAFGNLIAGKGGVPTEINYGSPKATATITCFLDQNAIKLFNFEDCLSKIELKHGATTSTTLFNCHIDTKPSFELSQAEAASGDFAFTATDNAYGNCAMIKFN